MDTHRVCACCRVFEHPVNFQWSDRLGGTAGKKKKPAKISNKISHSWGGNASFFLLCGWQSLGLSVHHGLLMSFCITNTLPLAQKNNLSVGREGFTAENNSPWIPLLHLEVSFRKPSKAQNKVLIAEPPPQGSKTAQVRLSKHRKPNSFVFGL